jgi:UDP-glucose 4-epimerase
VNLNNKSVLVTGGAGFIGSHLVDRLIDEKPANLVVVDNFSLGKEDNLNEAKQKYPRLKIYRQDAADFKAMKSLVKRQGIQVVFNLAVIPLPASIEKPRWVYEQNNDITLCFCELAREGCFKTLIHFSSSEAYGTCQYSPMDENHPLVPTTPYGASKAAGDLLVLSYIKTFNIDAAIIRPFNNYGPRQNEGSYAGVIPLTIKRILSGESPVIYGDGEQTRDYIFVTDTTEAAVQIYNHETTRGRIINIGSGSEITINKLIKTIAQHMKYNKTIEYQNERPGDVRRLIANIDLAHNLLHFKPKTDFDNGLKLTIDWYRKNLKTG